MLSTLLVGTIMIGSIPLLIFFVKRFRRRRTLTRDLLQQYGAMRTLRDRVVARWHEYRWLAEILEDTIKRVALAG